MKTLITLSAITAVVAMLLASAAQADPARHPHDYLASQPQARAATEPQDIRDHAELRQLVAQYGNPLAPTATASASGFSWTDAGTGAGVAAGGLLILGAATTLALRRRRQLAL